MEKRAAATAKSMKPSTKSVTFGRELRSGMIDKKTYHKHTVHADVQNEINKVLVRAQKRASLKKQLEVINTNIATLLESGKAFDARNRITQKYQMLLNEAKALSRYTEEFNLQKELNSILQAHAEPEQAEADFDRAIVSVNDKNNKGATTNGDKYTLKDRPLMVLLANRNLIISLDKEKNKKDHDELMREFDEDGTLDSIKFNQAKINDLEQRLKDDKSLQTLWNTVWKTTLRHLGFNGGKLNKRLTKKNRRKNRRYSRRRQ
jgi:hypothetical protein